MQVSLDARQQDITEGILEHRVESLAIEYTMNKTKWVLHAVYRQPSGNATRFRDYMSIILDMSLTRADNILLARDLNLDALLPETSGKVLHDLCMTYDLHNLIKTATCFKGKPSLLDVILTNKPSLFHSSNISRGESTFHPTVRVAHVCEELVVYKTSAADIVPDVSSF